MSAKMPRVFTREFKINVCRQVHSGQKRPAQVCREHQLILARQSFLSLRVSRSWFYERPAAQEPTKEAVCLRDAMERLCLVFPGYGSRRVTAQLRRDGWWVNHKRILRVMQEQSRLCRLQRAFSPASPASTQQAFPNLLAGKDMMAPNQAWARDDVYNVKRLHSSLGYRPPAEFEARFIEAELKAAYAQSSTS